MTRVSEIIQMIVIMTYCHFSVTLLCIHVMFDMFVVGAPLLTLTMLGLISQEQYSQHMTTLIHWTTPIVYAMPLVFSGSQIYCDDMDLLIEARNTNSLLLANHGSRIDWMLAMICGHTKINCKSKTNYNDNNATPRRARVGFVCESMLQYMPIIGWYRALVCQDIFVRRSINKDASIITNNLTAFQKANTKRMLFLSPEGIVVDFSDQDKAYIQSCREYCIQHGYKPFDYILTPRHKGTQYLIQQTSPNFNQEHSTSDHNATSVAEETEAAGPVISICLAYVRNGKLLNCKMSSKERVIPDIYLLNQGIFGHPVDIYINLRRVPIHSGLTASTTATSKSNNDMRTLLMDENKWKNDLLAKFDRQILQRSKHEFQNWIASHFSILHPDRMGAFVAHVAHAFVILTISICSGFGQKLYYLFLTLFVAVSSCHTIGWMLNSTSMESIPFETGIKGFIIFLHKLRTYKQTFAHPKSS